MDNIANKLKIFGEAAEAIKKIEDQTKDSNFDWTLLFQEKKKIHLGWLLLSLVFFMGICAAAIFIGQENQNTYMMLFVAGLLSAAWVSGCIHLRFENNIITGAAVFALIIALLVSCRVITPSEGANKILNQVSQGDEVKKTNPYASK